MTADPRVDVTDAERRVVETALRERAREVLRQRAQFGGVCQRHGARLLLAEVRREHGQDAVGALIRELDLGRIFGFAPGTRFE